MGDTAAFFDMDHTITWVNSGLSFTRYAWKQGMVSSSHMAKSLFKIILYRLSLLNIERWYEKSMENLAGATLTDMEAFSRQWFEATLKKAIYREAVALIREHERTGHRLVIISNSPVFFVTPMAETLGLTDIICTQVDIVGGTLTGRLVKPLCYGEGKAFYARTWADENGIDLKKSFFYTDSAFDVALLREVGFPFATNPDLKLRREAYACNWPILKFRKESAF